MIETIIWAVIATIVGIVMGSFTNVLVVRLPENESINGRSFCRKCKYQLRWFDNIPIFSYLFLGGKCRKCREKISIQYPLVELLMGLLYLGTFLRFGFTITTLFIVLICTIFVALAIIDYKHLIIHDSFIIALIAIGVTSMFVDTPGFDVSNLSKQLNVAVTVAIFLALYVLEKLLKKDLIGFGDIKLFFAVGLFVGVELSLLAVFLGSVVAVIIEMLIKRKRKAVIPFGPYMVIGYLISIFYGQALIEWYLQFFQIQ